MSSPTESEFRCSCGKLLCKGFIGEGFIEIKCRRCGLVSAWEQDSTRQWVLLESDTNGILTSVAGNAEGVFGYTSMELLGKELSDLVSIPTGMGPHQLGSYEVRNATFVLRDGAQKTVMAYVAKCDKENPKACRMYGVAKN